MRRVDLLGWTMVGLLTASVGTVGMAVALSVVRANETRQETEMLKAGECTKLGTRTQPEYSRAYPVNRIYVMQVHPAQEQILWVCSKHQFWRNAD